MFTVSISLGIFDFNGENNSSQLKRIKRVPQDCEVLRKIAHR